MYFFMDTCFENGRMFLITQISQDSLSFVRTYAYSFCGGVAKSIRPSKSKLSSNEQYYFCGCGHCRNIVQSGQEDNCSY